MVHIADIVIDAASVANTAKGMRAFVFVSHDVGYFFTIGSGNDLDYHKSTDGGKTWGAAVDVFTGTVSGFDIWYDQWTPGNTDRNIHIWYFDTGTDDVDYKRLNTTNDVLSAAVNVFTGATGVDARGVFVSGARMRGGNLLCCFDIDAGEETGTYKSVDNGASWSAMTNAIEATLDQCQVFPANVADSNDAWLLYDDDSAAELTLKEYDDSGNSFTESAALTFNNNATDNTGQYGFSGSIRHSDGHLIVGYMDAYDAAGASDFKVYDINGTGSLTELTDIATNVDDIYYPSVFLDQNQPDWIYVAYVGKSDGSETIATTAGVYYALSKDRGLTWTKDIAYSTSVTDYRQSWAPLNGERFMVAFFDISALETITNHDNSKEFGFTKLNNYMRSTVRGANAGIVSSGGIG